MLPRAVARRVNPVFIVLGVFTVGMFCTKVAIDVGGKLADEDQRVEELKKKTEMSPFTPSVDGAVAETRLLQFLEIRKRVLRFYDPHKAEIEATTLAMEKVRGQDHGAADVFKAFSLAVRHRRGNAEVHTAQVEGQAAAAMNGRSF